MEGSPSCDIGDSGSNGSPSAEQWINAKPILERLYIHQNIPLPKVIELMEQQQGFVATAKMYKARFSEWGWAKNASRSDWLAFAKLRKTLDETGKSSVYIKMHNKIRTLQELRRFLKSHNEVETAFFDEAATAGVPDHVKCCDENGNHLIHTHLEMQTVRGPSTPQSTPILSLNTSIKQNSDMAPYLHAQPTEGYVNHDELQASYVSACMCVCVYGAAGKKEATEYCLQQTSDRFRQMCELGNPYTLTAANLTLAWLFLHANGRIPERIMMASFQVAVEVLGSENLVCVLLEWMSAAATKQLESCPINSTRLQQVWHEFKHELGDTHGHTITAMYCLSFHLILADKQYAQAEEYLEQLVGVCAKTYGSSHILTINALATLSRAQQRQKKHSTALMTIEISLAAVPLGPNHPHRLELLVRKAIILGKLGRRDEMEELYWNVVRGRVATLGLHHPSTLAAHDSLVSILRENNTWEAKKGDAHQFLIDPQITVSDYESFYFRIVEANRATSDDSASSDEE